ncbi:hypothetical protein GCM10010259_41720 [Streptomyces daghestanicus]|uniref:Uncharacterized protein n=2 Tax=Streptomyces TaxID=1883 RepID=A0A918GQ46_STRGD|nr:hypothetical protein GCM10010238_48840 [Streptomyces niveoruber]GGU46529.1 hypothetical protein GCM10010259_41720 [Streptomyces daghestanicus]GHI33605.1 hypothetical protein Sdagh_53350 [Streptomyces daghestanicus]
MPPILGVPPSGVQGLLIHRPGPPGNGGTILTGPAQAMRHMDDLAGFLRTRRSRGDPVAAGIPTDSRRQRS